MADASVDPDRSEWDVVVVGAGPPGENAAQYATQYSGLSAVMVEKELVGGECSYWACMPSKALLQPIRVFDEARNLPGTKEILGDTEVDAAAVLARRDSFTHDHDDSSQVGWATSVGIDVVRGTGRLTGPKTVEVTKADGSTRTLTARHAVVLATGTSAFVPPVDGLREARPWTSRDVTNLHEIPRRVLVIGGGVVACESATWLHGLGVEHLTVVEGESRLLAKNEPFAGEIVADRFRAAGITVHLDTHVTGVRRDLVNDAGEGLVHGGELTVTLSNGESVVVDEVVVAAGRKPNSDIGLDTVGAAANEHGFVDVDDHLQVPGVDWLYAIGDLCGRALLTHMGKYQGRLVGEVVAARAAGTPLDDAPFNRYTDVGDHGAVPQVTFTDPEVASVGLTAAQAREQGVDVETAEFDMAQLAGTSLLRDDYVGRANLVVDRATDILVGATFVGDDTAELVHSATVAVVGKVTTAALWHCVPSYPTASEVWLRLLETLDKQRRS
ncbi:dihydrolipoyl dehydrogenase family protein [Jatrophihabitans sp. YIM 134969]